MSQISETLHSHTTPDLYVSVYGSFVYNRPKLDLTQMSLAGESMNAVTSVQWITAQE